KLSRYSKRRIMLAADAAALPVCVLIASWLVHPAGIFWPFWIWALPVAVSLPIFRLAGLYRSVVRFMGRGLVSATLRSVSVSAFVFLLAITWIDGALVGMRVAAAFWLTAVVYVVGSRFGAQWLLHGRHLKGDRVIIYGAGEAGARLVSALAAGDDFLPTA